MAHPENRGEGDPPARSCPKVSVVKLLKERSKSELWSCNSPETFLFYRVFVCVSEERLQRVVLKRRKRWHAATARWIRARRGLFWGTFRSLGPRQKALIKRSSRVGGKWVISCTAASDGANSFASSQHLQPLSWTNLTPAP